jgi:hypothetical protein
MEPGQGGRVSDRRRGLSRIGQGAAMESSQRRPESGDDLVTVITEKVAAMESSR